MLYSTPGDPLHPMQVRYPAIGCRVQIAPRYQNLKPIPNREYCMRFNSRRDPPGEQYPFKVLVLETSVEHDLAKVGVASLPVAPDKPTAVGFEKAKHGITKSAFFSAQPKTTSPDR